MVLATLMHRDDLTVELIRARDPMMILLQLELSYLIQKNEVKYDNLNNNLYIL